MKYLGIDFGTKRIGISFSDEDGRVAFPLSVLENSEKIIEEIKKIISEKKIDKVVVGESKDFNMKDNPIMKDIKEFSEKLLEDKIAVVFHPEFFTSQEAIQIQGKNEMLDASAATIILQSYLDKQKNDINR